MRYLQVDQASGTIIAVLHYPESHPAPPVEAGSVLIVDDEADPAAHRFELPAYGPWQRVEGTRAVDLGRLKAEVVFRIDREAEMARGRILSPGAGQAMEYLATEAEARACIAAGTAAVPADYPLLAAEMAVRGGTLAQTAAGVLQAALAWRAAGARIKQLRLAGKDAVAAATTAEAVNQAAAIDWES